MQQIFLVLMILTSSIQSYSQESYVCNVNELATKVKETKSEKLTFVIKAKYFSIGKSATNKAINLLSKKGLLRKRQLNTSIEFELFCDNKKYYLPMLEQASTGSKNLTGDSNTGKTCLLTVTAFKDFLRSDNDFFFIIDAIKFLE